MAIQLSPIDAEIKQTFRKNSWNIVEMTKKKEAIVPKGYTILQSLQTEEDFNKILDKTNWAVTQTVKSNGLIFDLEHNNPDPKLNKLFNRRRDRYEKNSELVNSKHGFCEVIDADHDWCVEFTKKYHKKCGFEMYAEKHWGIFGGSYYNPKNIDEPERETTWFPLDDLHEVPIIRITKKELGEIFSTIPLTDSESTTTKTNVFTDGLETGSRNSELFKQACAFFDQGKMQYATGLDLCKLVNQASNNPLPDDEFHRTVSSAWDKVHKKDENDSKPFNNKRWPDAATAIQSKFDIVTVRETKDMWIYSEKDGVYIPDADTYIEEESQKLILKCTTKSTNEIKNQIKRDMTMILSSDFFDSIIINTESGIIDSNTYDVLPHSPKYLTTTKLPFRVDMKANNFKLWNHITHNIIEKKDSKLLLEILWVLVSWDNPHKKCIIFKGLSDTQKTTLMEIISWIIGSKNIASVKPQKFLESGDRFSMSRFIGKRANFSEEINNLTPEMLENLKAMIGGMVQETELKNSNDGREFNPKRFLFLFSTNFLDSIYQRINDNSTINRFQFMMFKHIIKKKKGDWANDFFIDEDDKRTAIETIIRFMISWKKSGQEVQWDEAWKTKENLRAEQSIEDKYFESGRIIEKRGGKLLLDDVKTDFISYCQVAITNQGLGILMAQKGFESKHSGLKTYYHGYALSNISLNQTLGD